MRACHSSSGGETGANSAVEANFIDRDINSAVYLPGLYAALIRVGENYLALEFKLLRVLRNAKIELLIAALAQRRKSTTAL